METERLLLGSEALRLQGLDVGNLRPRLLQKYSNNFMMNLAGNMFSGTVVMSVLASLVLSKEWKTDGEAPETDAGDVDAALALFKDLKKAE